MAGFHHWHEREKMVAGWTCLYFRSGSAKTGLLHLRDSLKTHLMHPDCMDKFHLVSARKAYHEI